MKYAVTIERNALKTLQKIPNTVRSKIITAIEHLAENPRPNNSKKTDWPRWLAHPYW